MDPTGKKTHQRNTLVSTQNFPAKVSDSGNVLASSWPIFSDQKIGIMRGFLVGETMMEAQGC